MSVKQSLIRAIATWRFRRAAARLALGPGSQLRSLALYPAANGRLEIGCNSIFAGRMAMDREGAVVRIGDRTFIGKGLIVAAQSVDIGSDVLLSWDVTIVDHHSHNLDFDKRADDVTNWLTGNKDWTDVSIAPVKICDKVWVGFGTSILPGVTIGEGAIVGACSVVTRNVEPWTVVAGNPAREIRRLTPGDRRTPADIPAA